MTRLLLNDRRGAIYVEFLVVFLPILTLFLALFEMTFFYSSQLLVQYAANRAVRAAIVVIPEDAIFYADGSSGGVATPQRMRDIQDAAQIPLAEFDEELVRVNFGPDRGEGTTFGRDDLITVHVEYDYPCKVFIIDRVLCRNIDKRGRRFTTLSAQASHHNQGAMYGYNGEAQ